MGPWGSIVCRVCVDVQCEGICAYVCVFAYTVSLQCVVWLRYLSVCVTRGMHRCIYSQRDLHLFLSVMEWFLCMHTGMYVSNLCERGSVPRV